MDAPLRRRPTPLPTAPQNPCASSPCTLPTRLPTSQFNETTEEGVVFIPHPPSLMREPPIEPYKNKHLDDLSPAAEIRQLLSKTDTGKRETGGVVLGRALHGTLALCLLAPPR